MECHQNKIILIKSLEEFFINNYTFLTFFVEFVAVVAGILTYKKFKGTTVTFFIKIIWCSFIIEIIGSYSNFYKVFDFLKPIQNSIFKVNYWWFTTTYLIGVVILISTFYQKILDNIRFKSFLKFLTIAYILFALSYIVVHFDQFFKQIFPVISILAGILVLTCCVLYLIELLSSNKIINFYKSVNFYITIGLFFWWIVVTPLTFYDVYMVNSDWDYILLKWQVYLSLNFMMYTIFAVGLIISKPEKINH